jgi:hypothetical protein
MSASFTVVCSEVEYKALQHYMADVQDWLQITLTGRAGVAIDDLVKREMARMLADPTITNIPADKNTIVLNAPFTENNESTPPPS